MFFSKKKVANEVNAPMDLDEVMKKYDRESNTRVWEGTPKIIVNIVLAAFALFCIYVTLFTSWLEEIRLTSFMACIVLIGYLMYPVKKGKQKVNFMPWYDWVLMILGTGSFLYSDPPATGWRYPWYGSNPLPGSAAAGENCPCSGKSRNYGEISAAAGRSDHNWPRKRRCFDLCGCGIGRYASGCFFPPDKSDQPADRPPWHRRFLHTTGTGGTQGRRLRRDRLRRTEPDGSFFG